MDLIAKFAGKPFTGNCADFVAVALAFRGKRVSFPQFDGFPDENGPHTAALAADLIAAKAKGYPRTESPSDGDVVVLWSCGSLTHVGVVVFDSAGRQRLLHVGDEHSGHIACTPFDRLGALGYAVDAIYRI